jgi:phosphopentomutase
VLDSAGISGSGDAEKYEDSGANTLGHVLEQNLICRC